MRTWKIILVAAFLSIALIVTIGHSGFLRDKTITDHLVNTHQQIQQVSPVADPITSPGNADARKTPDIEPWGPARVVDW